jgi:SAM-dependent methyltransferase
MDRPTPRRGSMIDIDKEFIALCYRVILDRNPDVESVVEEKLARASSAEELIREFFDSAGFKDRLLRRIAEDYFRGRARIDVDVSEQQRLALFQRIQTQWRDLGRQEPFWSVLTHDDYRTINIDDAGLARFYESGAHHAALLDLFCGRNEVEMPHGVCLELGCGVGRVTKHLAKQFEKVIAVDVSEGNLDLCRAMAEKERLANIECVLLQSPTAIAKFPKFDCFYSTIVLQHNPPPLQRFLLDSILKRLNAGGVFLFQTQTHAPGYEFNIQEFLESPVHPMDMHSFPMNEIFKVIEERGHSVCEVAADSWTGRYGSHTFFGFSRHRRFFGFSHRQGQRRKPLESASS